MIYLASSSPRRQQILKMLKLKFRLIQNGYDEREIEDLSDPKKFVILASKNKALSVVPKIKAGFILSADTIGYFEGEILLKPKNMSEAIQTLSNLRGKTHTVFTGITLIKKAKAEQIIYSAIEKSTVTFGEYSDELIKDYVLQGNSEDKAASYGIQDRGAFFVKKINGCFFNVMGLPVNKLLSLLIKAKYPLI